MLNFIDEKLYISLDESGKLNQSDIANFFVVGSFLYSDKNTVKNKNKKNWKWNQK